MALKALETNILERIEKAAINQREWGDLLETDSCDTAQTMVNSFMIEIRTLNSVLKIVKEARTHPNR